MGRGSRLVDVCLPRKETNIFRILYPVMLGLSALCLLVANVLYLLLRRKTFLNNVMFHYTLMLFLAYAALVLIQKPELWEDLLHKTISRLDIFSLDNLSQFYDILVLFMLDFFICVFVPEILCFSTLQWGHQLNRDINENLIYFIRSQTHFIFFFHIKLFA